MAFVTIVTLQEVPAGQGRQVTVRGKTLAVFNVNGTFFAVDDTCPHRGASLWEGEVEGTEVSCPLHGARFDLATGRISVRRPAAASAPTWYRSSATRCRWTCEGAGEQEADAPCSEECQSIFWKRQMGTCGG
jgi:nitrite reductase/ring-hydroxylating ferredoxin subunit